MLEGDRASSGDRGLAAVQVDRSPSGEEEASEAAV